MFKLSELEQFPVKTNSRVWPWGGLLKWSGGQGQALWSREGHHDGSC